MMISEGEFNGILVVSLPASFRPMLSTIVHSANIVNRALSTEEIGQMLEQELELQNPSTIGQIYVDKSARAAFAIGRERFRGHGTYQSHFTNNRGQQ